MAQAIVGEAGYWHVECAEKHYGKKEVDAVLSGMWLGKPIEVYVGFGPTDSDGNVLFLYDAPLSASCTVCLEPISADVLVTRMEDCWPDYFGLENCPVCNNCDKSITAGLLYSVDGVDYCERCADVIA